MADKVMTLPASADKYLRVFKKSLPLQMRLHETLRVIRSTEGETCLEIGTFNGIVSYHLRRRGGDWCTAVLSEAVAATVKDVVPDNVYVLTDTTLPFKKQQFDVVVIMGQLESMAADELFIEECHRVLKPDGRLIVNVAHVKAWTLLSSIRRILGVVPEKKGMVRAGYTESQLFSILKHGFDVLAMKSYSRFFVELVDTLAQRLMREPVLPENATTQGRLRLFSILGPLYWIAFQLDVILFSTSGHHLIASAKRRAWRPRNAPVLVDGRSISEAVLSRPAD